MTTRAFQGQNDAPAPAQGSNQSVFDNPTPSVADHDPHARLGIISSSQPGNRIPSSPALPPREDHVVEENPVEYGEGLISTPGDAGGFVGWQSHPGEPNFNADVQAGQSKLPTSVEYGQDGNPIRRKK